METKLATGFTLMMGKGPSKHVIINLYGYHYHNDIIDDINTDINQVNVCESEN